MTKAEKMKTVQNVIDITANFTVEQRAVCFQDVQNRVLNPTEKIIWSLYVDAFNCESNFIVLSMNAKWASVMFLDTESGSGMRYIKDHNVKCKNVKRNGNKVIMNIAAKSKQDFCEAMKNTINAGLLTENDYRDKCHGMFKEMARNMASDYVKSDENSILMEELDMVDDIFCGV